MNKSDFFKRNNGPILFAHRGCSHAAPENTLAAFKLVKEWGIPGVELDVRLCATGEMVVFHDDNFSRIFGIDGSIEATSLTDLKELDAGLHKGENFRGERVPLLSEVFDLLGKEMIYDIEIKSPRKVNGVRETELFKLIKAYGLEEKCIISSFNPFSVKKFRQLAPSIPTAVIYFKDSRMPWYLRHGEGRYAAGSPILKPKHKMLNRNYIRWNSGVLGYPILPWTVNKPRRVKELLTLGVSGIISNRPEDLMHLFRKSALNKAM